MTLYVPRHFTGDAAAGRGLIAAHPFAMLVSAARDGIQVTHLPLLLDKAADALIGHVARANPHAAALAEAPATAIFRGPHAFVSRHWYGDPADNVPTWNYAAVHVTGRPRLLDAAATRAALLELAARFEPQAGPAIREDRLAGLIGGIVAFALPLERVEVKLKMSQNRPGERAGILAGLRDAGDAESLATAAFMDSLSPLQRGEG